VPGVDPADRFPPTTTGSEASTTAASSARSCCRRASTRTPSRPPTGCAGDPRPDGAEARPEGDGSIRSSRLQIPGR